MRAELFKILHSELISYFQLIEYDVKMIYVYMSYGNTNNIYESIKHIDFKEMLNRLEKLDKNEIEAGNKRFMTDRMFNALRQLKNSRNYWCHEVFLDIISDVNCNPFFVPNDISSNLNRVHDVVLRIQDKMNKRRIKAEQKYSNRHVNLNRNNQ